MDGTEESVEKTKEFLASYSLQSGGNKEQNMKWFAAHNWGRSNELRAVQETIINNFINKRPDRSQVKMLTLGPRWSAEIKFLRNKFNIYVLGLDLFTNDEEYVVVGDMHKMRFADNTFDILYEKNTYNKSYDIRKALDESVRVLKPGGMLMYDEALDYTIGVNENARTNIKTHQWTVSYLGDLIDEILWDREDINTKDYWINKTGTFAATIKKMSIFIIAEAGANHDRNKGQAFRLIDVAVRSGADAVKFQTYSSETLYSKNTPDFAGYKNIPKLIKDIELPRSWQKDLKLYCDDRGIEFMSTPFDEQAVDELYELGVKRLKIAGFEATDPRWVKYVASTGLPLIVSLGSGVGRDTIHDIQSWILGDEVMNDPRIHLGTFDFSNNPHVTYLHCNSAYPTPLEDINLGTLDRLQDLSTHHKWFRNTKIGLSDHTEGILIPPVAVALGAQVIEKHFTLNRNLPGPDHPFAIEPSELKQMVTNIRNIEKTLGCKKGEYTKSEQNFSKARRSVVASQNIKKGQPFTEDNITTKRPLLENSVPATEYYKMLGRSANYDISEDEILLRD